MTLGVKKKGIRRGKGKEVGSLCHCLWKYEREKRSVWAALRHYHHHHHPPRRNNNHNWWPCAREMQWAWATLFGAPLGHW